MLTIRSLTEKVVGRTMSRPEILPKVKNGLVAQLDQLQKLNMHSIESIAQAQRLSHAQEMQKIVNSIAKTYASFLAGLNDSLDRNSPHLSREGERALLRVREINAQLGLAIQNLFGQGLLNQTIKFKQEYENAIVTMEGKGVPSPNYPPGVTKEIYPLLNEAHKTLTLILKHVLDPKSWHTCDWRHYED